MKYRGWTLVDRHRWCFAVNDKTGVSKQCCLVVSDKAKRLRSFHRLVDQIEGSEHGSELL